MFQRSSRTPKTKFSIIIPFRNEEENLSQLLHSILRLSYPSSLFEVLLIDDDSQDNSVEIINNFKNKYNYITLSILKTKRSSKAPKKDSITTGIAHSKHDWIITTDADCIVPMSWLETFDHFIQNECPKMIIAPVTYHDIDSFIKGFQLMDLLSLQGTAIGSFGIGKPFLCNGANFAYSKQFFVDLKGFEGNSNIASGDDVFLLEKAILKEKESIRFLKSKDQIVTTKAQPNFAALVQQRVRWAKKMTSLKTVFGKGVGLIVFLMNLTLLVLLIMTWIDLFRFKILAAGFIIKAFVDFCLIYKSAQLTGQKSKLIHYIQSSICYPFFSVFVVLYSLFFNYKWKGRGYFK